MPSKSAFRNVENVMFFQRYVAWNGYIRKQKSKFSEKKKTNTFWTKLLRVGVEEGGLKRFQPQPLARSL